MHTTIGIPAISLLAVLAGIQADAATTTAYISNCCASPSVVSVFHAGSNAIATQFVTGNGAFDAVFSPDGATAYVSNNVSRTVSVIATADWTNTSTIAVGYAVEWMALSKDGIDLYVGSFDAANSTHIVDINTAAQSVVKTLNLSGFQSPLALSPDGKKLYVNYSPNNGNSVFATIDTATLTVVSTLKNIVGTDVAVSADGKYAYVPNFGTGEPPSFAVAVIDLANNTIVKQIPLDATVTPDFLALSPDGSLIYVSEFTYTTGQPRVAIISTSARQVVNTILLPKNADPGQIAFAPGGARAYVTDFNRSGVYIVDVSQSKIIGVDETYGTVNGLAVSPNGSTLLVPNEGNSRTAVVSPALVPQGQIAVGSLGNSSAFPRTGAVAVSADGARAYVTNQYSNNVSVIDTVSDDVIADVFTGMEPIGVVVSPDGSTAYVANSFDDSISIVNTSTFASKAVKMPAFGYPTGIAIAPDGSKVYMTIDNIIPDFGNSPGYLCVLDTTTETVIETINAVYPMGVAVSKDGSEVYVVSEYAQTVLFTFSPSTGKYTGRLPLGGFGALGPISAGVALTPDGSTLFVDDGSGNVVWKVDTLTNKLVQTNPVGKVPGQLAVTPDGSALYVTDYVATSASVINTATGALIGSIPLHDPSYGVGLAPH